MAPRRQTDPDNRQGYHPKPSHRNPVIPPRVECFPYSVYGFHLIINGFVSSFFCFSKKKNMSTVGTLVLQHYRRLEFKRVGNIGTKSSSRAAEQKRRVGLSPRLPSVCQRCDLISSVGRRLASPPRTRIPTTVS